MKNKQAKIPTSGECLQMSLKADAAILLRGISGSWIQSTNNGTAPASTTACDSSGENNILQIKLNLDKPLAKSSVENIWRLHIPFKGIFMGQTYPFIKTSFRNY